MPQPLGICFSGGATTLFELAEGGPMNDFVIIKLQGSWTVTHYGFIVSCEPSTSQAIRVAVNAASSEAANGGEHVRVMMEDTSTAQRIIWDSWRDTGSQIDGSDAALSSRTRLT
jgi:co-chaperonin GroES (HSP10)